jgi:predicted glycogen debranching enzyme
MSANQPTRLVGNLSDDSFWKEYPVLETFFSAAKAFIRHDENTVKTWAASRDWFMEEWGRDTFISLPGLLLVPKRFDEAKENIRQQFARHIKRGLIPNRIPGGVAYYNTVDASMWFIQAIKAYYEYSGDLTFVFEMLGSISEVIEYYKNGTSYFLYGKDQIIKMDAEDSLIISPVQATWMDADISFNGTGVITPRNGKVVEINALWYSNLRFIAALERHFGRIDKALEHDLIADKVKVSFNSKFWNYRENALRDCIEGDSHGDAIRPNMLFAISHGGDLLPTERKISVFEYARKDLLTPGGLRTLSSRDSQYIGIYNTYLPIHEKDRAYHQGTVWPWLMGTYCDSLAIVCPRLLVKLPRFLDLW